MATLTPQEQQALNALLDEYRDTLGQIGQESAAQLERRKAFEKIEKQIQQIQTETLNNSAKKLAEINQAIKDNNELQGDYQKQLEAAYKQLYNSGQLREDEKQILKDQIEDLKQKVALHQEVNEELEKQQNFQKEIRQQGEDLLGTFTGIKEQQSGVVGLIQKGMNDGKSFGETLSQVGEGMGGRMQEIVTPINIAASITAKIVESTIKMVLETSEALANFNRMTTASGELDSAIIQASISTKQFGVSMSETVAAAGELYTSMSSFSQMTNEAVTEVTALAAAMERTGLAVKDFGQIADLAMKGFGMSQEESLEISKQLLGVSQQLGIPMSQLGADFTSSMAELAKYGPEGIEVFKELAAMAKAAGVEVNTLLGIAKNFDTIEGAAQATSRLNAILGSTLNTVEMLNASESERIMMIKQSIEATGQSFGSMDRFKQQAIANAAGITNMADANKLFNTSGAKFREELAKMTGETGDLKDATSAATSIGDNFKLMIESLAVGLGPLVSIMSSLIQVIVFMLTPVNYLLNLFTVIGTKLGELTGLGQGFADAITSALFLVSAAFVVAKIKAVSLATAFTTMLGPAVIAAAENIIFFTANLIYDFVAGIGTAIIRVKQFAVTMATQAVGAMKTFGLAVYNNVIVPLGAAIMQFVRLSISMVGSLMTGIGVAIGQLVALGAAIYANVVVPMFAAIASVFSFAASLIAAAIPAILAVTAATIKFTIALLTNPVVLIGMAIVAVVYLIYDNFELLFNFVLSGFTMMGELFSSIGEVFGSVIDGIVGAFTGFINLFISGINMVIGALNSISFTIPDWVPFVGGEEFGINIPLIPMLEEGGQINEEGTAYLHAGEKVIPAAQVEELDNAVEVATNMVAAVPLLTMGMAMNPLGAITMMGAAAVGAFGGDKGGEGNDLISVIKENTMTMKELLAAAGADTGDQKIVLELNERELGTAVAGSMNSRQRLKIQKGGR